MMNLKTFAALPFLILAAPALAEEPPAAFPPFTQGALVCLESGTGLECNQPMLRCQQIEGPSGVSTHCRQHPAQLEAHATATVESSVCRQEGGVITCRHTGG